MALAQGGSKHDPQAEEGRQHCPGYRSGEKMAVTGWHCDARSIGGDRKRKTVWSFRGAMGSVTAGPSRAPALDPDDRARNRLSVIQQRLPIHPCLCGFIGSCGPGDADRDAPTTEQARSSIAPSFWPSSSRLGVSPDWLLPTGSASPIKQKTSPSGRYGFHAKARTLRLST